MNNKYRRMKLLRKMNLEFVLASFDIYRNFRGSFQTDNWEAKMSNDCASIKITNGKTITSAIDLVQFVCNLDSVEGFEVAYNYLNKLDEKSIKVKIHENNIKNRSEIPALFD